MLLFFFEQQHQASCVFLWLSNGTKHLRGQNRRLKVQKCVGYKPCSRPKHVLLVASGPSSFPVFCPVLSTCIFYIKTELLSIYCLPVKGGAKIIFSYSYLFTFFHCLMWVVDMQTRAHPPPPLFYLSVTWCEYMFCCVCLQRLYNIRSILCLIECCASFAHHVELLARSLVLGCIIMSI